MPRAWVPETASIWCTQAQAWRSLVSHTCVAHKLADHVDVNNKRPASDYPMLTIKQVFLKTT